jgi:hypothetical protein
VRKGEETYSAVDKVPEQLRVRTVAVRAFDVHERQRRPVVRRAHRIQNRRQDRAINHGHLRRPRC